MDDIERTKLEVQLRNQQRILNKKYAEEGLTDEILDEQIKLNQLRHEYDITDESEKVYEDFVQ
ncbi:MAG: hypothetical protein E7Z73_10090 [Methanobrevibacter millerae]|uniref:Uncharacterized protein n=1 Tax=Methanobrevibacter millerae TaxID=230361 RepID=A0A8T3VLH4_9EURY|nr:hypothetical protein [Methanobrevibacter millerae]MBE6506063.1 hypothetical protein [Methanobrevibacter millerae]